MTQPAAPTHDHPPPLGDGERDRGSPGGGMRIVGPVGRRRGVRRSRSQDVCSPGGCRSHIEPLDGARGQGNHLRQCDAAQRPDPDADALPRRRPAGRGHRPHQHPGQQVSHVTSGTLTYTVMAGAVTLVEAPVDGKPGPSRVITAPATIEVTANQSLTEPAGEIHRATNLGSSDVRIDIAVLVPQGDPISVPAG